MNSRDPKSVLHEAIAQIGVKIYRAIAQLLSMHLRKTSENLSELMPHE
jgi:hypothetical protein